MRPGGPTQDRLSHVLGPRLAAWIGPDPLRPRPQRPPRDRHVVRQHRMIPTRMTSILADEPDAAAEEAMRESALSLSRAIADRVREVETGRKTRPKPELASAHGAGGSDPSRWAIGEAGRELQGAAGRAAAGILRGGVAAGRAAGLDDAADNLEHFLDGTGENRTLTPEEAARRGPFRRGVAENRRRFEKAFLRDRTDVDSEDFAPEFEYRRRLLAMKDGDMVDLPIGPKKASKPRDEFNYDIRTEDNLARGDVDEALATGSSKIRSTADDGFTAVRVGDRIIVWGAVTHRWDDDYDFHDVGSGALGNLARHGGARTYQNRFGRTEHVTAAFDIVDGELTPDYFDWRDAADDPVSGDDLAEAE
jgi:hypothetical protein